MQIKVMTVKTHLINLIALELKYSNSLYLIR